MMYTQMDIGLDVITGNCKKVPDRLPEETGITAVVKMDTYGLGTVPTVKKLEKASCPIFAVVFTEEAVKPREAGIKAPILVMMPAESKELLITGKRKLIITITDYEMAKQISDEPVKQPYSLPAYLKVDCELSRMDIILKDRLEKATKEAAKTHALPNLNTEAILSHLMVADTEGAYTALDLAKQQRFFELIKMLEGKNTSIKTHLVSSDPCI